MVYGDGYKKRCYFILADFIVNCKEQVLIIGIKSNMQFLICHILLKKRVNNIVVENANPLINAKSALIRTL